MPGNRRAATDAREQGAAHRRVRLTVGLGPYAGEHYCPRAVPRGERRVAACRSGYARRPRLTLQTCAMPRLNVTLRHDGGARAQAQAAARVHAPTCADHRCCP